MVLCLIFWWICALFIVSGFNQTHLAPYGIPDSVSVDYKVWFIFLFMAFLLQQLKREVNSSLCSSFITRESLSHSHLLGNESFKTEEFGISWCKLSHVDGINNKVLLHDPANHVQNPAINRNEREYEKECLYAYNWVTLLYSRGWNNIVNQLHFNWKKESMVLQLILHGVGGFVFVFPLSLFSFVFTIRLANFGFE